MQLIRRRILAKRQYPLQALQRHQEGVVRLRFALSAAGTLDQGVEVVQTSGVQVLDNQARASVLAAAPFPPIPPDLKRDRLVVEVPVIYRLSDAAR
jgi:protein TonB